MYIAETFQEGGKTEDQEGPSPRTGDRHREIPRRWDVRSPRRGATASKCAHTEGRRIRQVSHYLYSFLTILLTHFSLSYSFRTETQKP